MTFKEKFENFWYYYKWHCILAIVGLLVLWLVLDFINQPGTDLNISLTSEGSLSEGTIDFNTVLPNLIEDANGDGEALITISRQFITKDLESSENREHVAKLNNQLSNKGATLFIVDQTNFDYLIKKDAFASLDEWLDTEAYGDRLYYRDGVPIALSLKGSRALSEMKFTTDELYALVLFRRPEDAGDALTEGQYQNAAKVLAALTEQIEN